MKPLNLRMPVVEKPTCEGNVYNSPGVKALREKLQAEGKWPPRIVRVAAEVIAPEGAKK